MTFRLQHTLLGKPMLHPFPFNSREQAERYLDQLRGKGFTTDYEIVEIQSKQLTEDQIEEMEDRLFENNVVQTWLETGNQITQL